MFKATAAIAFATVILTTQGTTAQEQTAVEHKPHFEFIVNSGTIVPTGAQRDAIKRGKLNAAQLSYVIHPSFALTGTFGWARTRDIASADDPKLDMFTYDIGGELRGPRWLASQSLSFSPFAGIGAGGRSYNYRSRDVDATHNLAGYASAGGELGIGRRVSVRVEARDYVTGFEPLTGIGSAATRNDLSVMAGLRIKAR